MSSKFRAWLRVTPSPTTLVESSAIHKQLKSQGQIHEFVRALRSKQSPKNAGDDNSTLYYTSFTHEPLHLQKSFNVTAHSNIVDPKEADPYNIRGLQNRKPHPAPKTFTCVLEKIEEDRASDGALPRQNLWHGSFRAGKGHWFQTVLEETGAPPGIARGLSASEHPSDSNSVDAKRSDEHPPSSNRVKMDSLMVPWHEAMREHTKTHTNRSLPSRREPVSSAVKSEGRSH